MKEIVAFTMNPAIDKSSSVDHVIAEQKLYCKAPHYEPGGGGVNVSRAIKKLGGESMLLYPAGGLTGEKLKDLLQEEEITHRLVPIEGMTRESLVILEESTGQQFRFGMPGPELLRQEWERCLDGLSAVEPAPFPDGPGSCTLPRTRRPFSISWTPTTASDFRVSVGFSPLTTFSSWWIWLRRGGASSPIR